MRQERFPTQRKSKLSPRGDGPFRVLEKINDNAYKLELPGELNISPTFNVADLAPFCADDPILRTESLQEGGDDEDSPTSNEEIIKLPTMRNAPRTRAGIKSLREEFNQAMESMITLLDHEELKGRLLQQEITRETPMEAHGQASPSKPSNVKEAGSLTSTPEPASLQASKNEEKFTSHVGLLPKTSQVPMLPVLEGRREVQVFSIQKARSVIEE